MSIYKRIFMDAEGTDGGGRNPSAGEKHGEGEGGYRGQTKAPAMLYTFPVGNFLDAELHFEGYETLLYGKDKSGCVRVFYRSKKTPRQIYQNEYHRGYHSTMMGQLKKEWARMLIADFGSSVRYLVPQSQVEALIAPNRKERL